MIRCLRAQRAQQIQIVETDIAVAGDQAASSPHAHSNAQQRLPFATVSVSSLVPSGSNPVALINSSASSSKKATNKGSPQMPAPTRVAAASGTDTDDQPSLMFLITRRPDALLHRMPRTAVLFLAGAVSGAIGKTFTAPLDRVKILMQVGGGRYSGEIAQAAAKGDILRSLVAIAKQDGIFGYWRGNLPQVGL